MSKITFRIGGVHPDDNKISRNCAIETLPLPPTVYVSMSQHIGAPAKPVVAAGDKVKVGQVIAEPGGFVSAFIHSPVSGTVKGLVERKDLSGKPVQHTIRICNLVKNQHAHRKIQGVRGTVSIQVPDLRRQEKRAKQKPVFLQIPEQEIHQSRKHQNAEKPGSMLKGKEAGNLSRKNIKQI